MGTSVLNHQNCECVRLPEKLSKKPYRSLICCERKTLLNDRHIQQISSTENKTYFEIVKSSICHVPKVKRCIIPIIGAFFSGSDIGVEGYF
jgi:hypothetical protein